MVFRGFQGTNKTLVPYIYTFLCLLMLPSVEAPAVGAVLHSHDEVRLDY